jgi:chitin disaccharide deacetylase
MIIINADDWGRSQSETDAALSCFRESRITSVSAMVFMEDSGRSAELARDEAIDVGLHLNLSQPFTGRTSDRLLLKYHSQTAHFLTRNKYALLFYNPLITKQFQYVYQAQIEEFIRLFGRWPSHIDGHQHLHLCSNILIGRIIGEGEKVRRSFSFQPGEKSVVNRAYRGFVDRLLARRHRLADFFFALSSNLDVDRLTRIADLAKAATVEMMTHPVKTNEYACLMSDSFLGMITSIKSGSYSSLG